MTSYLEILDAGDCNTRRQSQNCIPLMPKQGVGWLRLQINALTVSSRKDLWTFLHCHFGSEWEVASLSRSGVETEVSAGRIPGARLRLKNDNAYELELTQSVVELMTPLQVQQLLLDARAVFGNLVKCSRVDFYKDTTDFTVQNVRDCVQLGFAVMASKTCSDNNKWVPPAYFGRETEYLGDTLYIGSRESSRFGRFYDKGLEQGQVPNLLTRFEAEMKRSASVVAFGLLCDTSLEDWPNLINSMLLSIIDFRDIYTEQDRLHSDRMPRQQWWSNFIENANKLKLWIPVSLKTPLDSYLHLVKQYAPTIVMISEWCQTNKLDWDSFYDGLLLDGKRRLKSKHRVKIAMVA